MEHAVERAGRAGGHVSVAPAPSSRALWAAYAAIAIAVAAFVVSLAAAPWLRASGHPYVAGVLYECFARTCHQMSERSYWLLGSPLAVCSRCASIYAGALAGVLLLPLVRGLTAPAPARRWLLIAAVPAGLDFSLGWLGILDNTFLSRGVTGVLLGAVSAFYVVPGLTEALASFLGPKPTHGDAHGSQHEEARAD